MSLVTTQYDFRTTQANEGIDDQLNKAIEVILEQLKDYPEIPAVPAFPDKSR